MKYKKRLLICIGILMLTMVFGNTYFEYVSEPSYADIYHTIDMMEGYGEVRSDQVAVAIIDSGKFQMKDNVMIRLTFNYMMFAILGLIAFYSIFNEAWKTRGAIHEVERYQIEKDIQYRLDKEKA